MTERSTYRLAGQIIAVRVQNTLSYAYGDHLGNISAYTTFSGNYVANSLTRYEPYGNFRGTPPTSNPAISDRGFTGHRHNNTGDNAMALIYMNARYYLPETGRFISADTIVPSPQNPQSFNRYSYVMNNPVKYTDPSGHALWAGLDEGGGHGSDKALERLLVDETGSCNPTYQSCEIPPSQPGSWLLQQKLREACSAGNCLGGHLWVYFGVPYTQTQRESLVYHEARRLCYELGSCATAEVSLYLEIIAFPFGMAGNLVSTAFDAGKSIFQGDGGDIATEAGLALAEGGNLGARIGEEMASRSGIPPEVGRGLGGQSVGMIGTALNVNSWREEMQQWESAAQLIVDQRIAGKLETLQFYWQVGSARGFASTP